MTHPEYWRQKVLDAAARSELHRAIFAGTPEEYASYLARHRSAMHAVRPGESVLDIGCGYGRMLDYLPKDIRYVGIDVSPDLVGIARRIWPTHTFHVVDARPFLRYSDANIYDVGICVWLKTMLCSNGEAGLWSEIEYHARRVCKRLVVED